MAVFGHPQGFLIGEGLFHLSEVVVASSINEGIQFFVATKFICLNIEYCVVDSLSLEKWRSGARHSSFDFSKAPQIHQTKPNIDRGQEKGSG